jgi:hypothetical protein
MDESKIHSNLSPKKILTLGKYTVGLFTQVKIDVREMIRKHSATWT